MEKLFQDLERLWELEVSIPDLENSCMELEEDVAYERDELNYAKIQLLSLDSPNFFLKLMPARLENQRELARAEVRSHTAALEEAKRALEAKRYSLEALKEEYQALLPRREEYTDGKGSYPADLEQHLVCTAGIRLAEKVLFFLEAARKHMRGVSDNAIALRGNRKMEFLAGAAQNARKLKEILDTLPTPLKLKGSYLTWPDHYITEPSSPYAQLDRVEMALDTVREVRRQLRELL